MVPLFTIAKLWVINNFCKYNKVRLILKYSVRIKYPCNQSAKRRRPSSRVRIKNSNLQGSFKEHRLIKYNCPHVIYKIILYKYYIISFYLLYLEETYKEFSFYWWKLFSGD